MQDQLNWCTLQFKRLSKHTGGLKSIIGRQISSVLNNLILLDFLLIYNN
jgi:hypothetical protein